MAIAIGGNSVNKAYLGTTEIQKMYLGSELVFDNSIQPSELTPIMTNFRVEDANKDRVYFDTPLGPVTGLTTTGFVISGETILAVNSTLNYFTVDTPFTFWDNNTIRLGVTTDLNDVNPSLHNFTLEYIENNIVEVGAANTDMYAEVGGTGDGSSIGNPSSLEDAFANASAGQTWHVKAGNYGNVNGITFDKANTPDTPIKFIGYKDTPGDITSNYFDYGVTWSTDEMPTVTGDQGTSTSYLFLYLNSGNLIIKNFQMDGYYYGVRSSNAGSDSCTNLHFERWNTQNFYDSSSTGKTSFLMTNGNEMHRYRFRDMTLINNTMGGITLQQVSSGADYCLIDNCRSYNDNTTEPLRQDYHLTMNGSYNIIRKCTVENFNSTSTNASTHGITIKGAGYYNNLENLIADNHVTNAQEGAALRNYGIYNNVIKRNIFDNNNTTTKDGEDSGGAWIWGGSFDCVVEDNITKDVWAGIAFRKNVGEDGSPPNSIGDGNIIRNNVYDNCKVFLRTSSSSGQNSPLSNTSVYNNTILGCTNFRQIGYSIDLTDMRMTGNIFDSVPNFGTGDLVGITFLNNTFWNSWSSGIGTGAENIDPQLDANYQPQVAFASVDAPKLSNVNYDKDGVERADTTTRGSVLSSEEAAEQPPANELINYDGSSQYDSSTTYK